MSRLVFLDCESTTLDVDTARIVELCIFQLGAEPRVRRINPGVPIPAEATEVHGIKDNDVADCPRFRQLTVAVQELVTGAILCTFNGRRFDSLLLDAELRRSGQPGLARDANGSINQPEIDLYQIWIQHERRGLAEAALRFAGAAIDEAHSAGADTRVLPEILDGMRHEFGIEDKSIEELCKLCVPEDEVDRGRKFVRRADGVPVFNIGKVKDVPVTEDPGFLTWMLGKDFPEDSKAHARRFLAEIAEAKRKAQEMADEQMAAFASGPGADKLPF